jgi:Ca2+-binding EF-hand superfamily protein
LEVFNEFDLEKKGYITAKDIEKLSKEVGENLRQDTLKDIMNNCSEDQNYIYFEDFYQIMNYKNY